MKYLIALLFVISFIVPSEAQNESASESTTYYLIRHAEKDRSDKTNRNPNLTESGKARAENWSKIFASVDFDAIFSTDYNRTMQTAMPTAKSKDITIQTYDPRQLKFEEFAKQTEGKTVLIVGHSNTTPMFANAILGKEKFEYMDDSDNGSLFVITVIEGKASDQVLHFN